MKSSNSHGASGSGVLGEVEGRMKVLSDTSGIVSALACRVTWRQLRTLHRATNNRFAVKIRCLVSYADFTKTAHVGVWTKS